MTKSSTISVTKSYSFYSKNLNVGKFNDFLKKAEAIRDYKNALSIEVSSKLLEYTEVSKFEFIKIFGTQTNYLNPSKLLRGNEIQKAAVDVFEAYQNKITQIKQKMSFSVQKSLEIERYKRNTKHNKRGDVRSCEIKTKSTPLTKSMTFLARYGSDATLDYVNKRAEQNGDNQIFYITLKNHIEEFGLQRLLRLALNKRKQILSKYNHPIIFSSLSYRSALQSSDPLIQNSNNKSFANGVISIPSFNGRHMLIPTTFNIEHHGHLNQYTSREYTICVEQKRKRIRLITTRESTENISPEGTKHLGVDTNIKHNLFATSDGANIDMDRDLFRGYVIFLKKYQDKREHSAGEEQQLEVWQRRVQYMLKKKARELVDHAIALGKDHIIMEDLGNFSRSFIKSGEFNGFKYSRLIRLLNLASLNKIVKGICKKLGVRLTLIHSHYTSQWCFNCGHIDRANRTTQEIFQCVCCNVTSNADFHSSQAILKIGSSDVLKSSMLVRDKSSDWIPKKLSKSFIRKQLEEIITKPALQLNYQG